MQTYNDRQVYLERHDPARNMARFYAISIERTLFGQWAVIRHWGRVGAFGDSRETWVNGLAEAEAHSSAQADRRRRRGYRPAN